jgi:hypothetical protein
MERARAQDDHFAPVADVSGCWDTRWLDLLAGCHGSPEQIAALRRASIVCVLGRTPPGRVPWPRPAGSHRLGVRRAPPRGAQRTAPGAGCGEHARGGRRPRRCRCGEEFRGLGRRIADALGRRHGAGWPSRLTCVETWRSSGEAVGETSRTIARHSPGAAAPTARSRAVRGCRQASMCRVGAIAHGRQLPPLSPPQRVNKGRNLRQVPSQRAGCPGTAQ